MELIVHRSLCDVSEEVPPHFAVLEPLGDDLTRLRASTSNLEWFASRILSLPFEMEIISPSELRDAARRHAERLLRASQGPTPEPALNQSK